MMFGIGTEEAQLHIDNFTNLLGANEHSWGMSHKGIVWHNGTGLRYAKCFKENLATTIGLLFDGIDGTLTYYKDGVCLGVAFRELNMVCDELITISAWCQLLSHSVYLFGPGARATVSDRLFDGGQNGNGVGPDTARVRQSAGSLSGGDLQVGAHKGRNAEAAAPNALAAVH